jgi:hypothetical protein
MSKFDTMFYPKPIHSQYHNENEGLNEICRCATTASGWSHRGGGDGAPELEEAQCARDRGEEAEVRRMSSEGAGQGS